MIGILGNVPIFIASLTSCYELRSIGIGQHVFLYAFHIVLKPDRHLEMRSKQCDDSCMTATPACSTFMRLGWISLKISYFLALVIRLY